MGTGFRNILAIAIALHGCGGGGGDGDGDNEGEDTVVETSATGSTMMPTTMGGTMGPTTMDGSVSESGADPTGEETSTPMGECDGIVGEGFAEGQIAENWTLNDADGNPVNLHDYCGKVIYFESGSEW